MKFEFIRNYKPQAISKPRLFTLFNVSKSGYHNYLKSLNTKSKTLVFEKLIVQAYYNNKGRYGYRKLQSYLASNNVFVSEHIVRSCLRKNSLKSIVRRKYRPPQTTQSKHKNLISPRVFKIEDHKVTAVNQVWVSDITYLKTKFGFVYLVVFLDIFSRKVVSWKISHSLNASFVLLALDQAIKDRKPSVNLIIHSDRGVQYTCYEFRTKINQHSFIQSMSRKGNCYDNAYAESFFALMKKEMQRSIFLNLNHARTEVFKFIEAWYNTERIHSALDNLSPNQYESNKV